jgi:hypothetical protein
MPQGRWLPAQALGQTLAADQLEALRQLARQCRDNGLAFGWA